MIKGTRPPEKVLAMAKKLKVPVTQLEWGKGSRQYLTTSFIKSILKRKLHNKKFGKPKYKPLPVYPNWDWGVEKKSGHKSTRTVSTANIQKGFHKSNTASMGGRNFNDLLK